MGRGDGEGRGEVMGRGDGEWREVRAQGNGEIMGRVKEG